MKAMIRCSDCLGEGKLMYGDEREDVCEKCWGIGFYNYSDANEEEREMLNSNRRIRFIIMTILVVEGIIGGLLMYLPTVY